MATTVRLSGSMLAAPKAPTGNALTPPPSRDEQPHAPAARPPQAARLPRSAYFRRLLTGRDRTIFLGIIGLWILANYQFFTWWFQRDHMGAPAGYLLNTLLVSIDLIEPAWFFYFVWRMRAPISVGATTAYRVAAATTKTPGEPLEVVGETLLAIKAMTGEHDTWLLDEGADPTVRAWCESHGIKYFTRKGIEKYQQPRWPFQARMKAGNYNSFLDYVGYDRSYDVFCQFDSDHRPQPDYLQKMLVALERPQVAYVAAPSNCHGNREDSWAVLGRAELEAPFHGPLQTGFNDGFAPLIIGSHCTFRLSALRELGGFQTTWCEDHDNSLAFNAIGYEGVFQKDAIAVGDGPTSFAEAMQQEYQWSRGLMQILLNSTPFWLSNLSLGKKIQFLFCQFWYPRLGLVKLGLILLPLLALLTNSRFADVPYGEFWLREFLVGVPCLAVVHLLWVRGWTRPAEISYFSWRTVLFLMARWPWVLLGVLEACLGKLLGKDFAIKVTAKGKTGMRVLPIRILYPYIAIVVLSVAVSLLLARFSPEAAGYSLIGLISAAWYTLLIVAVVYLHLKENARQGAWKPALRFNVSGLSTAAAACAISLFGLGTYFEPQTYLMPGTTRSAASFATAALHDPVVAPAVSSGQPLPVSIARPQTVAVIPDPSIVDTVIKADTARRQERMPIVSTTAFPPGKIEMGAFDPNGALAGYNLQTELIFHFWRAGGPDELIGEMQRVLKMGRQPVVTLQPRPLGLGILTTSSLLPDIANGGYDVLLRNYAQAIRAQTPDAIVVRFAPEMELKTANLWARGRPDDYINAYRHVVDVFRAEGATNVVWMWSPAGNGGAEAYYPGDSYVDLIGVTILASEAWDRHWGFDRLRSFRTLLAEKYGLADRFEKPIVIAELGVAIGDRAEEDAWLADARATFKDFPRLRGVAYFNARQPSDPPQINIYPDWRLQTPDILFDRQSAPPLKGAR